MVVNYGKSFRSQVFIFTKIFIPLENILKGIEPLKWSKRNRTFADSSLRAAIALISKFVDIVHRLIMYLGYIRKELFFTNYFWFSYMSVHFSVWMILLKLTQQNGNNIAKIYKATWNLKIKLIFLQLIVAK